MAKLNYKRGVKRIALIVLLLIQIAGIICIGFGSYSLNAYRKGSTEGLMPDVFIPLIFIPLTVILLSFIALILLFAETRPNGHEITIGIFFVPTLIGILISLTSWAFLKGEYDNYFKTGIGLIIGSVITYIVLYIVYGIGLFVVKGFAESGKGSAQ